MKILLFLLLSIFLLHFGYGQDKKEIFDQLHENVWYLPTDDEQAKLYVTSIGRGDTIVTLHGGPGNNFNYLVDAVRGNIENNTFIFFDQRGSILSPVQDSLVNQLSIDLLVEDLETLRKALNQEKMVLMGHSFGTLLAMFYYDKYPQHVEKLILTASMPPRISRDEPFTQKLALIHQRIRDLRSRDKVTEVLRREGLEIDSLLSPQQRSDKLKITGQASFNMYNIENWRNFKGGGVYYNYDVDNAIGSSLPDTYSIEDKLKTHPIPVTIIQGDKDYIDPSAGDWSWVLSGFDLVNLLIIPNASHNSWLDNRGEFDKHLLAAISNAF